MRLAREVKRLMQHYVHQPFYDTLCVNYPPQLIASNIFKQAPSGT